MGASKHVLGRALVDGGDGGGVGVGVCPQCGVVH